MNTELAWPSFLPIPQKASYSYQPTDRRGKVDMELGGRLRVLYDTDETVLHCNVILDKLKLAFFEAFEKHLLGQGSKWFDMPVFIAGRIEPHRVRFRERPKIGDLVGLYATVTMVFDVAKRDMFDEFGAWFLYEFGIDSLIWMNRLHEALHVKAPGVTILCS